jgi:hypothetical protein
VVFTNCRFKVSTFFCLVVVLLKALFGVCTRSFLYLAEVVVGGGWLPLWTDTHLWGGEAVFYNNVQNQFSNFKITNVVHIFVTLSGVTS